MRLEAAIELTDAARALAWPSGSPLRSQSRLIGFEWNSDNGWTTTLDPPEPTKTRERLRMIDTLLNWDVWQPSQIAAVIDQTRRRYSYDTGADTLADLERRAQEIRAALEELSGDARHPGQGRAR